MDTFRDNIEEQTKNIKKLRNELTTFSKTYKINKFYTPTQNLLITDVTNKLRYGIEQYCFYLNMLQDLIQITIPVDPFVDVLDIVGNEELSEEKQLHLLNLLHGKNVGKNGLFSEYEIEWFNDVYTKIDFVIENYSFLQCWENSYQMTISQELTQMPKDSENTKMKIMKKFEKLKKNTEDESADVFGDFAGKATAEAFEDKLKSKNKQITTSLIRSNQILKSTVLQTDLNLEEIYIQGNMLTELNDKFDVLDTLLTQSSKIMKLIEKNGSKEKRRVYMSFGFLILCISWVLWKRLIRGPLKLVLWLWFNFFKKILYTTGVVGRKKIVFDQPIFEEVTSLLTNDISKTTSLSSISESVKSVINSTAASIPTKLINSTSILSIAKKASIPKIKNDTINATIASISEIKKTPIDTIAIQKNINTTIARGINTTIDSLISENDSIINASNLTLNSTKAVISSLNKTAKSLFNSTS